MFCGIFQKRLKVLLPVGVVEENIFPACLVALNDAASPELEPMLCAADCNFIAVPLALQANIGVSPISIRPFEKQLAQPMLINYP